MFVWMFIVRHGLNFCGFDAQVPYTEPAHPMDIYPLMINCNGFHVGGTSWSHHCEKFPGSSMTGFSWSCFRCFLSKQVPMVFYMEFDATILEE